MKSSVERAWNELWTTLLEVSWLTTSGVICGRTVAPSADAHANSYRTFRSPPIINSPVIYNAVLIIEYPNFFDCNAHPGTASWNGLHSTPREANDPFSSKPGESPGQPSLTDFNECLFFFLTWPHCDATCNDMGHILLSYTIYNIHKDLRTAISVVHILSYNNDNWCKE